MKREDLIRKEILMQLYAVRPIAVNVPRLQRDATKAGYDYSVTEIAREVQFLVDTGLVIEIGDPGVSAKMYRIHANGVKHYEQTYAA